jgi:autotransporter-associated beta strand protein
MKSISALRSFLAAIGASIIALSSASAATLFWDGGDEDILTDGNGVSGGTSGTWNTAILNWDAGESPHVAWNNSNNDTGVFAGATGTVTLGADVTVGGLTFNTASYIIAPGTGPFGIAFGAPGDISVSTGTTTISAGTLEVTKLADGGNNSGIGSSAALVNNLRLLANTTLRYTGSGDSTDRNFSLLGSATLDSSGAGPLAFSETGALSPDVTALAGTFVENSSTVTVASTDNLAVGMSVISDAFTGTRTINAITSGTSIIISSGTGVLAGDFTLSAGIPVNRTLTLRGSNTGANTISGVLQNSTAITTSALGVLSLAKNDGGTWVLGGNNTYTGTTVVSAGTLIVNGNQSTATGSVAVSGTSTLGGSGTLGGNVAVAATANLAPGEASVGTLSFGGNLTLTETASDVGTLNFDLGSIANSDKIVVTGTLNVGTDALGLSDFNFTNAGGLQNGTYTLIASGAAIAGPLAAGDLTGTFGGADIELKIVGNNLVLEVTSVGGSTPYEDWATGGELFEDDANGDGVSNGVAFLLGASGPNANALGLLPAVTQSGGGLVMTFSMLNSSSRGTAALSVEHSSDLGISDAWTTVLVPDTAGISGPTSGVTFDVTLGSPGNTVTATISSGEAASGRLFGRLKATE